MVGNPSVPVITLCALALHASMLTPHNIVAEEASSTVEQYNRDNSGSKRGNHLRRQSGLQLKPLAQALPSDAEEEEITRPISDNIIIDRTGTGRKLSSCHWYPENQNSDGCTNRPSPMLTEWLANPQAVELMLSPTGEACCEKWFGDRKCSLYPDPGSSCESGSESGSGPSSSNSEGCISNGWHADMITREGCTDDNNYPEEWLLDEKVKSLMLFATSEKCCDAYFPGKDCSIQHSGCQEFKAPDTSTPQTACFAPGWYADGVNRDGCTNADTYPKQWLENGMKSSMFFLTFEECCNTFFQGGMCKKHDLCAIDPTIGDSSQGGGGGTSGCESEWHPDTVMRAGCSNDSSYPPVWKEPQNKATHFFLTAGDCCQHYSMLGGTCQVRNACNANAITTIIVTIKPTASPTKYMACAWHPSMQGGGGATCDYSNAYPEAWLDPILSSNYLYDSHDECCLGAFNLETCGKNVICATPTPTLSPTTEEPTPAPLAPSTSPTSSPISIYYIQHNTGLCVRESEIRRPYYITETFIEHNVCCTFSPKSEKCLARGPTQPPTIFQPTTSPRPTTPSPTILMLYWVDRFTGICKEGDIKAVPSWAITQSLTYKNYKTCCRNSFQEELCLEKGPTQSPTAFPTPLESSFPSIGPSNILSSVPSQGPSEKPKPTTSPTTLFQGALKAFSSKPTLNPTHGDCSDYSWFMYTENNIDRGCSNSDIARSADGSLALLFQTAEECCAYNFEYLDCPVRDDCQSTASMIYAEWNFQLSCDNYWHPDIDNGRDGCSDARHFPDSWQRPANKANLLFDTAQECCQKLYIDQGNDCKIYNYCASPTDMPTKHPTSRPTFQPITPQPAPLSDDTSTFSCENANWHVSVGSDELACSNSLEYPDPWNDAALSAKYLFDNHMDCCKRYFPDNPSLCIKHHDCESEWAIETTTTSSTGIASRLDDLDTSCVSAKWHMTPEFSKCTNNFDYPLEWLEQMPKYFFADAPECCVRVFNYADCPVEDICASDAASTGVNYPSPTYEPTETPSTGSPTPAPFTGAPTTSPITGNPTPVSSTKRATPKPIQKSSGLNQCIGKTRKQCAKDSGCKYDRAGLTCEKIESKSQPVHKPLPNEATADTIPSTNTSCGRKTKRECVKVPTCTWDPSIKSCSLHAATSGNMAEMKGEANAETVTQKVPSAPQDCDGRRWHPRTVTDLTCSNSLDYPPLWEHPPYSAMYSFDSFEHCCQEFYNGRCTKEDVCDASSGR